MLQQVFGVETAAVVRPFTERIHVRRNQRITTIGEQANYLYIVQVGEFHSEVFSHTLHGFIFKNHGSSFLFL